MQPLTQIISLSFFLLCSQVYAAGDESPWVDYDKYTHDLLLKKFRGGTHDPDGKSEYYFKTFLTASPFRIKTPDSASLLDLADKDDEVQEGEAKKKAKTKEPVQEIVEAVNIEHRIEIESLMVEDILPEGVKLTTINGDLLRDLVARTMLAFDISEPRVEIEVTIEIWEENKEYIWFGEDQKIRSLKYFPFGLPTATQGIPKPQTLTGRDEKGLFFEINTTYSDLLEENTEN